MPLHSAKLLNSFRLKNPNLKKAEAVVAANFGPGFWMLAMSYESCNQVSTYILVMYSIFLSASSIPLHTSILFLLSDLLPLPVSPPPPSTTPPDWLTVCCVYLGFRATWVYPDPVVLPATGH